MKIKLLLATLAVAAAPSLTFAACIGDHAKEEVVMSCPQGATFDAETNSCVSTTS